MIELTRRDAILLGVAAASTLALPSNAASFRQEGYELVKVDKNTGKETPIIIAEGVHPGDAFFNATQENPGTIFRFKGKLPNGHEVHQVKLRLDAKDKVITHQNGYEVLESLMGKSVDMSGDTIRRMSSSSQQRGTELAIKLV